jgi:hypothetical protein
MSTLEKPFVSACLAGSLSQKLIWWAALGHRVFSLVGGNNTHSLPPVLGCRVAGPGDVVHSLGHGVADVAGGLLDDAKWVSINV